MLRLSLFGHSDCRLEYSKGGGDKECRRVGTRKQSAMTKRQKAIVAVQCQKKERLGMHPGGKWVLVGSSRWSCSRSLVWFGEVSRDFVSMDVPSKLQRRWWLVELFGGFVKVGLVLGTFLLADPIRWLLSVCINVYLSQAGYTGNRRGWALAATGTRKE